MIRREKKNGDVEKNCIKHHIESYSIVYTNEITKEKRTDMINIEKKTVSSPCPRCMLSYVSMYVPHVYRRVLFHHELTRLIYQEIELLMTITSFSINVKVIRAQQAELFLM